MTFCKYFLQVFLLTGTLIFSVYAVDINITGTVNDSLTQKGLQNATVSLKSTPSITATTDATGHFTLSGSTTGTIGSAALNLMSEKPVLVNNYLCFSIAKNSTPVRIELFNVSGKRVSTLVNKQLTSGNYRVDLTTSGLADQFYFERVQIGSQISLLKNVYLSGNIISPVLKQNTIEKLDNPVIAAKALAVVDTIIITETGHRTLRSPLTSLTGTLSFSVLANRLQSLAKISSVSPKGINISGLKKLKEVSFVEPNINPRFINSGSPDYLTVVLKQIRLYDQDSIMDKEHNNFLTKVVWQGNKTLKLTGAGTIDVGDIVLDSFPTWKVTAIELGFNDTAVIKGTLIGTFNKDTSGTQFLSEIDTFYTKNAYSYNASNGTGGADSTMGRYAAFKTAPAESTTISLQGSSNGMATAITPTNFKIDTAALVAPSLTLVFDLSRILRFYNGCNLTHTGGVNPNDPANKAYFFSHTVFYGSVAAFFGTPGQIQGYESEYNCTDGNCGVNAWMTIICNETGNIISGILMGNDDNDFTIAKGNITTVTGTNPYDFHYGLSNVDITGFQKASALGDSCVVPWHQPAIEGGNPERSGNVKFTLRFKTN